ncbi:MAG: hypothetical protein HZC55_18905 [Verrucomicrobia bacterium]|nr:hypothetical protein [Verrucomicrobiota bacterium]
MNASLRNDSADPASEPSDAVVSASTTLQVRSQAAPASGAARMGMGKKVQ